MDQCLNPMSLTCTNGGVLAHGLTSLNHSLVISTLEITISTANELCYVRSKHSHVFVVASIGPGDRLCTQDMQAHFPPGFENLMPRPELWRSGISLYLPHQHPM